MSDNNDLVTVLPGDNVTRHIRHQKVQNEDPYEEDIENEYTKEDRRNIKIGVGIRYDTIHDQYYATCAGRLYHHHRRGNNSSSSKSGGSDIYYIQTNIKKRYRPMIEDRVIGIIQDRIGIDGLGGDIYRVYIQSSHYAIISNLSFEGASKRNKPTLISGQIIYARIIQSNAAIELNHNISTTTNNNILNYDPITLSCCLGPHDIHLSRKDWMTNENAYGELRGGTMFSISLLLSNELLKLNCIVLNELIKPISSSIQPIPFEIAIGMNGYVWIHSVRSEYTILIQNAIINSEVCTPEQICNMVKTLRYNVEKQIQSQQQE